ncbi:MAG: thioredoxin-disulfide reductase [Cyanobacteria bacterium]|nr:thioredoxin-disulfide reductase [Cyanobacteriota bacterium]MDA1020471.1 thioredoxin-disulfide reductase [Cyanobacteriota bacterium]
MPETIYDCLIIGAGPAGLGAGLYASRGNLKTLILEKGIVGGQLQVTEEIENYPGMDHMTGPQISDAMEAQTKRFGCDIVTNCEVAEVDLKSQPKIITTKEGNVYKAKTVIIASGSEHRKLGVPGEEELSGKGVSYCAVCDGAFFKDRKLAVIGGGSSAVEEGNFLTKYASSVTLIHRRDELRAERILQNRFLNNPKTDVIWDTVVEKINGDMLGVTSVSLKNSKTGETSDFPCEGVFIYVGLDPNTQYLEGKLKVDGAGKVITNERMETNLPGVFAAGDIRNTPLKQAVTAASDGSLAATMAIGFVESLEDSEVAV